jgi:hypothetical protein
MQLLSREAHYKKLFPHERAFQWKQIEQALFASQKTLSDVSTIPQSMRKELKRLLPKVKYEDKFHGCPLSLTSMQAVNYESNQRHSERRPVRRTVVEESLHF